MLKKMLTAVVLTVLAVVGIPTAAQAYVPVPPTNPFPTFVTTGPGDFFLNYPAGLFSDFAQVRLSLQGILPRQFTFGLASVVSESETATTTLRADGQGGLPLKITIPAEASGIYTLTSIDDTGRVGPTITISVTPADAADSSSGLPNTGAADPLPAVALAGGLLALGAAFVIVLSAVRRPKRSA